MGVAPEKMESARIDKDSEKARKAARLKKFEASQLQAAKQLSMVQASADFVKAEPGEGPNPEPMDADGVEDTVVDFGIADDCASGKIIDMLIETFWTGGGVTKAKIGDLLMEAPTIALLARKLRANADLRTRILRDFSAHIENRRGGEFAVVGKLQKRMSLGPRSNKKGEETSISVDLAESHYFAFIYLAACSRSWVYPNPPPHRSISPLWRAMGYGPSRFVNTFRTVLAALTVFRIDQLTKQHPTSKPHVRAFLPIGHLKKKSVAEPLAAGTIPGGRPRPSDHALAAAHVGIDESEGGIIVAERWSGTQFELLILFEEFQWPFWVASDDIIVTEPLRLVYKRLHHRETFKIGKAKKRKRCHREDGDRTSAQKLSVYFEQSVVKLKPLLLAIQEAKKIDAI